MLQLRAYTFEMTKRPASTPDACPHCGSDKGGYSFKMTVEYTMNGLWGDENSEEGEAVQVTPQKTVWCNLCGKRVKRKGN